MSDEILAEVDPRGPRRVVGIFMLLMLGGLVLYLAFVAPPAHVLWQVFLIGMGLVSLWFAHRLQVATRRKLWLTETALTDSEGTVLARVEDIVAVNRGAFAIKPSNGFTLTLKNPAPRAWQPGLWWRLGRRVAVGGVTPGSQARPMADIIAVIVARREA
ncbi:hypothetical protein [Marivita sp. XM-24bin2]|jgi:hypothetical protein|uniref:hypothetical protein n=1 Tax=unclassified Marivita TaxID=2632480 RepID=UPI000D7AAA0B|nr:hypothetical protein [Marivita sp. XM-24bin2]MCR9107764.1 hypothetical protein [Paracoccaceae bacterium]PWL35893.1 MAG: hypothetical protein DCO97_07300 [Marivita sp. XM-24bin2]